MVSLFNKTLPFGTTISFSTSFGVAGLIIWYTLFSSIYPNSCCGLDLIIFMPVSLPSNFLPPRNAISFGLNFINVSSGLTSTCLKTVFEIVKLFWAC